MRRAFGVLTVLWAGWVGPGCGSCTEAGCGSILVVNLGASDIPAGTYEVASDLAVESCSFTWPQAAATDTCAVDEDDDGSLALFLFAPVDAQATEVDLSVVRNGTVLVDGPVPVDLSPPFYPNGEQCAPTCYSARVTVDVGA